MSTSFFALVLRPRVARVVNLALSITYALTIVAGAIGEWSYYLLGERDRGRAPGNHRLLRLDLAERSSIDVLSVIRGEASVDPNPGIGHARRFRRRAPPRPLSQIHA